MQKLERKQRSGGAVGHIFLSYAREDVDSAKELADAVGRAGHEVWWDQHIQGGSRFSRAIDQALKDAEAVVVLWSDRSVESAWVQDEAAEGRDSGRLVPVLIDACTPPLGFRQFQSVDLSRWRGGEGPELQALLGAIEATITPAEAKQAEPSAGKVSSPSQFSICVLPFVNMSGDPEQEYFSDGITEDIITDLSKVSALLVIARNTAFTFKGKVMDVKEVARALDVTHVMEGSVRKVGDRVRITAQLIDAATGGHVWADRYDRDLTDIFAIQDEISKAIVAALRVKLLPAEKKAIETRGTSSVEAYNLYLMARQQWTEGSLGDIRRQETIVRICEQALSFDPEYAQAWALMALAQSQLRFWHGTDVDPAPAAERALAINPNLAEAHCVKAQMFEEQGQNEKATAEIETAVRLDPDSWEVNREAARLAFRQARIEDAIPFFEKAAALAEFDWHNAAMLIGCYRVVGDVAQMRKAAQRAVDRTEKAIARDPSNATVLASGASALADIGENQRAKDWIDRALLLDPNNNIMRYNLACALTSDLNDPERGIKVLEPYFRTTLGVAHIRHAEVDPDLDPLRDDPRFQQMLADARARLSLVE
jgi:adenylate cyclase